MNTWFNESWLRPPTPACTNDTQTTTHKQQHTNNNTQTITHKQQHTNLPSDGNAIVEQKAEPQPPRPVQVRGNQNRPTQLGHGLPLGKDNSTFFHIQRKGGRHRSAAVPSREVCRCTGSHIHEWWSARQPAIPSIDAEGNRELTCIY